MQDFISTDSTNNNVGNNVVGVAHAEPPSEPSDKVEVDASIISDIGTELIKELTTVVADAAVIDILNHDEQRNRVRAAGIDPIAFRYINKA